MLVIMAFMFMLVVMAFMFMIVTFVFMIVIVLMSLRMLVFVLMIVIVCGLSGMARTAGKQISAHYAYPIYFLQHVFCY
mgnify:CR=1 FL=1